MSLSKLYCDIVTNAAIKRGSKEMEDISSAMDELLERLFNEGIEIFDSHGLKLNFGSFFFNPCGSMAEKTSLYKSSRRQGQGNTFIEFDFLAVPRNKDEAVDIRSGNSNCKGGVCVYTRNNSLHPRFFRDEFLKELYSRIVNMCKCRVDPDGSISDDVSRAGRSCPMCTVVKDTGYLQIAKIPDITPDNVDASEHCSIVCFWNSSTESIMVPNVATLQLIEKIKRLVIRVDLLPAFLFPQDDDDGDESRIQRFVIAKSCPYCRESGCFMVSYCKYEVTTIRRVSENHRRTFMIIKFLYGQFTYWTGNDSYLNTYHAKVAFIVHCASCSCVNEDCTACITDILQSVEEAYRSRSLKLPEFHPEECLEIRENYGDFFQIPILSLLHIVLQLNLHYGDEQSNVTCRPCDAVRLIKNTCRMLIEEGHSGIKYRNGELHL